jgi:hypothetical protein
MLLSLAVWLQNTGPFSFLRQADARWYVYPIVLALHLTFISSFAAMVLMTDLRLLGWALTKHSVSEVVNQLRIPKRIGFLLVATCGFLMFGMKAEEYYYNPFFRTKLVLFGLVAVHAFLFRRWVYNHPEPLDRLPHTPRYAKVAAALSIVLWVSIASAGRGIGYVQPSVPSHYVTHAVP